MPQVGLPCAKCKGQTLYEPMQAHTQFCLGWD
jgi:hypothetical protein